MSQTRDISSPEYLPEVTIVVPTYQEVDSLGPLLERIGAVRAGGLDLDVLIVDDDAQDGTVELIASLDLDWVQLLVRTEERG
ncbi:MAG: glycosyltransferase, partial [Phycisphaerae bacterium]|nr:glycosyltransferase [Phycisphaerae bacterium]